jgi:hypothetical protein
MISIRKAAMAAMLGMVSLPANAADWWLVSDQPGDRAVYFADADSLVRDRDDAAVRVLRIDRSGEAVEMEHRARCNGHAASSDEEALRRFACSTADERMHFAMMLGGMAPDEAAGLIFAIGSRDPR